MKKYLVFNSDGSLYQEYIGMEISNDDKTYINVEDLEFEPNIYAKEYRLVDNEVIETDIVEHTIPESELWKQFRYRRNTLLTQSDWTVAEDSPVDKEAWKTYRQALRDLPENVDDPTNVTWPTPPN